MSGERARATGAGAGGAAETVAGGRDAAARPSGEGFNVPDCSRATRLFQLHVQHLVEIAIVELAVVTDTDQRAAHQAVHRCRIEILLQQIHIGIMLALALQVFLEAVNRHIGDCQQVVKLDPVLFA